MADYIVGTVISGGVPLFHTSVPASIGKEALITSAKLELAEHLLDDGCQLPATDVNIEFSLQKRFFGIPIRNIGMGSERL